MEPREADLNNLSDRKMEGHTLWVNTLPSFRARVGPMNEGEAEVKGPGLEPLLQDLRRYFLYDMRVRMEVGVLRPKRRATSRGGAERVRAKGVQLQPYRKGGCRRK